VFAWGAMCGLSGDRPGFWPGWNRSGSSGGAGAAAGLDMLIAKNDNAMMAKKKNPHAQALGALGGKARAKSLSDTERASIASQGGTARAAKLSQAERVRIARLAVAARERKRKEKG